MCILGHLCVQSAGAGARASEVRGVTRLLLVYSTVQGFAVNVRGALGSEDHRPSYCRHPGVSIDPGVQHLHKAPLDFIAAFGVHSSLRVGARTCNVIKV